MFLTGFIEQFWEWKNTIDYRLKTCRGQEKVVSEQIPNKNEQTLLLQLKRSQPMERGWLAFERPLLCVKTKPFLNRQTALLVFTTLAVCTSLFRDRDKASTKVFCFFHYLSQKIFVVRLSFALTAS